jgi:hypothetical protein
VVRKVLQLISNTKSKFDACVDHTRPSLAVEIEGVKASLLNARNRGIGQGLLLKLPRTIFPIAKS